MNHLKISQGVQTCCKPDNLFLHCIMAELINIKPNKQTADSLQLLELKSVVRYSLNVDTINLGKRER